MKWLLDVNVILDVLTDRQPWADASARVLGLVERGKAEGYLAAHTVTTLYYLLSTYRNPEVARRMIRVLLQLLTVVPVDGERLLHALDLPLSDYEDAVQVACGERQGVDLIVTRNRGDFRGIDLDVLSPAELLARMAEPPT